MSKKAFDKIAAGLEDAIAFAEGDIARARAAKPIDVKAIRQATGKTREAFAATYHLPVRAVQDWEQNRRKPEAAARTLLTMIQADPAAVEKLIAKAIR